MNNCWAKSSLALVIVTLALSLLGAHLMGQLHRCQIDFAGKNPAKWEEYYENSFGSDDPWPYTKGIEVLGRGMQEVKTWLPLASGVCFLIALFTG